MKKRNQGFTLIEMIIVIAVIAILSAIAIPSFSNVLTKSEEVACASNRRSAQTTLQIKLMLDEIKASDTESDLEKELEKELEKMGITCPSHGKLRVKYNEDTQIVKLECSKHTETLTQVVLNKFIEMCENSMALGDNKTNDEIRKEMYDQQGGWNSIGFAGDNNEYFIQPYWNKESNEMYLFARTDSSSEKGWYTGYIYNHVDEKWYHGNAFSIVNNTEIYSWQNVWDKMQENNWKPVEVEYEN